MKRLSFALAALIATGAVTAVVVGGGAPTPSRRRRRCRRTGCSHPSFRRSARRCLRVRPGLFGDGREVALDGHLRAASHGPLQRRH
jgi:hypothetical protein